MTIEEITVGLRELLGKNHYCPNTLKFYENEWRKIGRFLDETYGDTEFDMERGLAYLECTYDFQTKYDNGTLSQQRVQLLRVVHMLEDYRLHGVLVNRYHASKNPISLNEYYADIYNRYGAILQESDLSACTAKHYTSTALVFLDYLSQKKVQPIEHLTLDNCSGWINTLVGYEFKTIEHNVCGLRHFLRFLTEDGLIEGDIASKIHMPQVSKTFRIPSAWTEDELKRLLRAIDRNSPIGKRDYAMILLACVLGLRVIDIKHLRFGDLDWEAKQLRITQHKTHKPLTLPLPDAVGWAIIDYIKNGRPAYYETDIVFIKHMPPFDPISDNNHLAQRITYYMNKAGMRKDKDRHCGYHSLRHSAGTMLLEMETPLPIISTILGHADIDTTGIYLKTDLKKLAECVLPLEVIDRG